MYLQFKKWLITPILSLQIILFGTMTKQAVNSVICEHVDILAISPDDSLLALYRSRSNAIRVYDAATYGLLETIYPSEDYVTAITFAANSKKLAWGESDEGIDCQSQNGSIYLYDLKTQSITASLENIAGVVTYLNISLMPDRVAFRGLYTGYGTDMQVWDISTQTKLASREPWDIVPAYTTDASTFFLGTTLSLGISNEFSYQIETWNAQTNEVLQTIELEKPVTALAVSSDMSTIASGDAEGVITLWEARSGDKLFSFPLDDFIEFLAFVREQRLISVEANEGSRSIIVWDISGQPKLIAQKDLLVGRYVRYVISQIEPTIYILNQSETITDIDLWNYENNNLEFLEFKP